jgi:nucleotide-binding universal stress UspA family protein
MMTMKTKSARNHASVVKGGILCGTDFSPAADVAVDVATDFARRLNAPLTLAHALELPRALKGDTKASRWLTAIRKRWVRETADASRKRGVEVLEFVGVGSADEVLVQKAAADQARMIVVSSLGDRSPGKWLLGSVAERTAGRAETPTLVLRNADPLRAWLRGKGPLKIFVCFNFTASAEVALRWTKTLMAIGPCEVVLGYINSPVDDYMRIGAGGRIPFDGNPPEVLAVLERDMKERARVLLGGAPTSCRVEDHPGATERRLAEMAREEGADLIVAGSRQYDGFQRLWDGSVSRGLLTHAGMSVAIVPLAAAKGRTDELPTLRHVLVSTDFSDVGNSAIPHAYSLVRGGGLVTLLHVVAPPPRAVLANRSAGSARRRADEDIHAREARKVAAKLRALVPVDAARLGVHTQVEVISDSQVGLAIAQAAERLGVDVVCFASRGRSGLSKLLLGSIAEEVIARVRRPVFVVRSPPR